MRIIEIGKKILAGLFLAALAYVIWHVETENKYLRRETVFSIAYIKDTYKTYDGTIHVKYTYTYKGINYEDSKLQGQCKVPGRYFIRISTEKPKYNELLRDKPVPEWLQEAPPEGWKRIPDGPHLFKP